MEDNRLSIKSKNLIIGDFKIGFFRKIPKISMEIPFAGMAFYNPRETSSDFNFAIDDIQKDDKGTILFGSDDFAVPTFLSQRENGDFDWITKDKNGKINLSFYISNDWTSFSLYEDNTETSGKDAFHLFGYLFSYAVLNHHACVLHGVVMEYNGKGILVVASAGTGKTTHTRMWRDRENALIINGDRCLCRKIDGKWYAYGMPWSGSSGEYINRRVPIDVIVSLKQDSYNHVKRMSVVEGTLCLMQRIFAPVWECDMQNYAFDISEELANEIPILELSCRPDFESVDVLKEAISKLEKENEK